MEQRSIRYFCINELQKQAMHVKQTTANFSCITLQSCTTGHHNTRNQKSTYLFKFTQIDTKIYEHSGLFNVPNVSGLFLLK